MLKVGGQDFTLRVTQSRLDMVDSITYNTKYEAQSDSIIGYTYQKLKNRNFKNFVDYSEKIISRFGTDGSKVLIQPLTSTHDSALGYQHYKDSENFRAKNRHLPYEKTVFEVHLNRPIEAKYILEHIANIMSAYDTIFVFRPWTDLDEDPRYRDIPDRAQRMSEYLQDNREGIVALDFEGPIPFKHIFSEGYECVLLDSYTVDNQGNTFYDNVV